MDATVWHSEPSSKLLYLYVFTCRHLSERNIGLLQGPWKMLHHLRWTLPGTISGHHVAALCRRDPEVLGPQDCPPLPPAACSRKAQIGWILGWANTTWPWFWNWIVAGLVNSPALPSLRHQGELSGIALASSPLEAKSKGRGQFSSFHVLRADYPTPTPSRPPLLQCAG